MNKISVRPQIALSDLSSAISIIRSAATVREAKDLSDSADALEVCCKKARLGDEAVVAASLLRIEARRRVGQLLAALDRGRGGRPSGNATSGGVSNYAQSLEAANLPRGTASGWQKIARVPDEAFQQARKALENGEVDRAQPMISRISRGQWVTSDRADYDGDEWYTPARYIELVRTVLGEIDLDPASNPHAQKTVRAGRFYTKEDDGLSQPWAGRVFIGPPYSAALVKRFITRLIHEYDAGRVTSAIALVNNCTDTSWCQSLMRASSATCFTSGRIPFERVDGAKFATRQGQIFALLSGDAETIGRFRTEFSSVGLIISA